MVENFVEFCRSNLNLEDANTEIYYKSLSCCVLDAVYSLRAPYETTIKTVDRYAEHYMNGDRFSEGDTSSNLIDNIENAGGVELFASNILRNNQKPFRVIKSKTVLDIAVKLQELNIETMEDFRNFTNIELLETVLRGVKGIGDAGVNYLFMLAGDQDRCKPDVHIHECVKDAIGHDLTNENIQSLFTDAVSLLKEDYPNLTVAKLDHLIWLKYSQK